MINRKAVEHVLMTGLAIGASIPAATRWDRKNYFYPDLPKGYQISQYDLPLASRGALTFETSEGPFTVHITRAHLEEDTAKLVHATGPDGAKVSLVDFNRSGAPLMEIVTEPDVRTGEQARRYAEELQLLLRSIGASDARHGARADACRGQRVAAAARQRALRHTGRGQEHELVPLGRASDRVRDRATGGRTRRRRARCAGDARLARGPRRDVPDARQGDIRRLPLLPGTGPAAAPPRSGLADELRAGLPELPAARRERYQAALGLSAYDAAVLVADPDAVRLFEATLAADPGLDPKQVANWVTGDYLRLRNQATGPIDVVPAELGALIRLVGDGSISRANAKEVLELHSASGDATQAIVDARGFRQISDLGVARRNRRRGARREPGGGRRLPSGESRGRSGSWSGRS